MRLLIADDDDYTREGLAETVDWEKFGINRISLARDGEEALRLAESEQPHIVLTDIRMPKLSGIEFARSLRETSAGSQLLFMSGYMDTIYLKSAIKLSAVDYIEKPIRIPELERGVMKAVEQINEQMKLSSLASRYHQLESNELAERLVSTEQEMDDIESMCRRVGFPTNSMYVCTHIIPTIGVDETGPWLEHALDYWQRYDKAAVGRQADHGQIYVILAFSNNETSAMSYLLEQFVELHPTALVSVGRSVERITDIPDSYRTSEQALARGYYQQQHRLLRYMPDKEDRYMNITELLLGFFGVLEHSPEKLEGYVLQACRQMIDMEYPDVDKVRMLFVTFAQAMLSEKSVLLLRMDELSDAADVERYIYSCRTIDEVQRFLLELCRRYADEVSHEALYSRVIRDTIDYIAAHINDANLDLREIADHVHLSIAHLGSLFKQETGKTIGQYISDYRIELSKKLMANEHYKIQTIAELCGYASASYFSKVFKSAVGITPVEYRKQCAR